MNGCILTEITDLFAQLALNLKTLDPTVNNEAVNLYVSDLNTSLNLGELEDESSSGSRVRVLDTALSLMCFKAPQVYDTVITYLVNTLVTVLSSSIACKPLKLQNTEYMHVGSEISRSDCAQLIEFCTDILQKLEGHGTSYQPLLYGLVKAAVSASCFHYGPGVVPILDTNSLERGKPAVSKLLGHLPSDFLLKDEEVPLRLLFWYLDPLILKNDMSNILKEAIDRPFMCLETAFLERMEWRSMLICLVFSPAMFVETRALLHRWFLMTGLASILELEIKLVLSLLDVISRPMRWGLSMEVGLKLPSSYAYFAHNHYLLRTLEGPIFCKNLPHIVDITNKMAQHSQSLDHKSPWATAMNFPNWFYLASSLLFRGKSIRDNAAIDEQPSAIEPVYITAAARYIVWIVDPTSKSHQELLIGCLNKASESWVLKKCTGKHFKQHKSVSWKKLKKPKTDDGKEDYALVEPWLEEFQEMYINYLRKINHSSSPGITSQQNVLLRRVPLGILIGYSQEIDEDGFKLLLHYAATGKLWNSQGLETSSKHFVNYYNNNEAVAGARLVFDLTDIVDGMSGSLFETEESGVTFVCSLKLKTGGYLLDCVKRLLEIEKGDMTFMLRDLYTRLGQWMLMGENVFARAKDFLEVIDALSHRLSFL